MSEEYCNSTLLSVNDVNSILKLISEEYLKKEAKQKYVNNPNIFNNVYVSYDKPIIKPITSLDIILSSSIQNNYMIINCKPFIEHPEYLINDDIGHFILIVIREGIAYVYPLYPIIIKELDNWLRDDLKVLAEVYDYSVQQHHSSQSCGWYCVRTIIELEEGTRKLPELYRIKYNNPCDKRGKIIPIESV